MNGGSTLTVGSLFAGIGGFDLGLERAGMRSVWQCEIDPYAQRVLAKHWPSVLRVPDIRDVHAGTVPSVDVICGGFPCQDLSYAGAGAGLDGARSGLWSEYARVVGELRPRYVVVENVAALLARGLGTVLGDLATLGYDAEYDCIPASSVGAPHRRDRIWLVAYPDGSRLERHRGACRDATQVSDARGAGGAQLLADTDGGERDAGTREQWPRRRAEPGDGGPRMAYTASVGGGSPWPEGGEPSRTDGLGGSGSGERRPGDWWLVEPDVGRVAHGVPARVDRLRSLGNALVPQIAEWIGRRLIEWELANTADRP